MYYKLQKNFVKQAPEKKKKHCNQLLLKLQVDTILIIKYVEVLPG